MSEPTLARWLRWLVYSSALVPLVIVSQYMSPFHFGKVMVLRTIVQIMVPLYLLLVWRDRRYLPKSHPITWAFLAMTLAFTLTTFTSVSPIQSMWGTLERMGGLFTFWHYFLFYIIAVSVLRTRRDWQTMIDMVISAGLVGALYGFLQRFNLDFILGSGGRERIFGTIGNPALFAGYQILVGYVALTMLAVRRLRPQDDPRGGTDLGVKLIGVGLVGTLVLGLLASPLEWISGTWVGPLGLAVYGLYLFVADAFGGSKIFYGIVGVLSLLAAAMTVVRGSLVGMVVATILAALLYSILFRSRQAKGVLLGGIATVCVFVFLGVLLRNTPLVQNSPYLRRVTDFSPSTFTVQTRIWAWTAGLKGWSESPKTMLLGWGPENFNIPFSKYFNPKFYTGPGAETFFDRAHNMFVEVLVTMGLIGELAYLSIFVTLFWTLYTFMRKDDAHKVLGIGLTAMTVAYIIHNSFIFDTSANFITFFTILAFVVHVAQRGLDAAPEAVVSKARAVGWSGMQKTAAFVMAPVALMTAYVTNVVPVRANFANTRAIVAGWKGDWPTAVNKYREAIDYDVPGKYEFRNRFAQYLLELAGSIDTAKVSNFDQVALTAIEDVKHNVDESPQDYLPLLYLSRLYITLGHNDAKSPYNQTALEYSTKALEISPTFVRTYYEIGQSYLNTKQYDKAFEWFKKAGDLNPDVGVTFWYMGVVKYQAAAETKDIAGYKEALGYIKMAMEKGYALTEGDTAKLVNIYVDLGDLRSVTSLFEQLVAQFPDKYQYHASLATAYAQTGRIKDAIAQVQKALELNPNDASFQKEAATFLKKLGVQP